ncbi:MAG: alkylation repair protein [Paenibacillaceae bacterium]|jgi:3-methyladenine DNA glycosylase AlkD|nr:alkylation repair protein [Paenibacillaceae bacterium]
MDLDEIIAKLEQMGTEQTKRTFIRHGAREPLFGVKVGDLKKLVKDIRKNQPLVYSLFDTGIHDAMYLAGLAVDPKSISREQLQAWVRAAYWYMLAEYTVAGAAAESAYALELSKKWMEAPEEMTAACGWSTYTNYISITEDGQLDLEELELLLRRVRQTVHQEQNRVRYTMNGFVIGVGAWVPALYEEALSTAGAIGAVSVNMGQTACKVPLAEEYIRKVKEQGKLGVKRKTCIC